MELKKLQANNVEAMNNFDDRLNQLFQKNVKTEAVILQVRNALLTGTSVPNESKLQIKTKDLALSYRLNYTFSP